MKSIHDKVVNFVLWQNKRMAGINVESSSSKHSEDKSLSDIGKETDVLRVDSSNAP